MVVRILISIFVIKILLIGLLWQEPYMLLVNPHMYCSTRGQHIVL